MNHRTKLVVEILDQQGAKLFALLLRITLRHDAAEDLLQELFLNLCQSTAFEAAQNRIAYATSSAVHLGLQWRKAQRRNDSTALGRMGEPSSESNSIGNLIDREGVEQLLDRLAELQDRDRQILISHYLQHESFEEIGKSHGRTAHHIRALCHKAIVRLRKLMNVHVDRRQSNGD